LPPGRALGRCVLTWLRIAPGAHVGASKVFVWSGADGSAGAPRCGRNRHPNGIYQTISRRGRQYGVDAWMHRFRHHFSYTWLDRGGAEGDLMELNGWSSPQMLRRCGASARSARARRTYDRQAAATARRASSAAPLSQRRRRARRRTHMPM